MSKPNLSLFVAVLASLGLLALGVSKPLASTQKTRPNIVVVMTDDQEDTGSMAYMPKTLSLIAGHGVTFKNSFVNLSLCAPSRTSFLTVQAAHNHGIKANSPLDQGGWEAFKQKEATKSRSSVSISIAIVRRAR